jgi:hypothetical protein
LARFADRLNRTQLFVDGAAVLLHLNDFVAVLVAAIAFSWDGCFYEETKSSQIQEVLDNLCVFHPVVNATLFSALILKETLRANTWMFVFVGAIIPWSNIASGAIPFWKYIVSAILILALRRIPITFMVYPVMPSLVSPLEALFVGHFGPIAVGTLFYMSYSRAKLPEGAFPELEPIATFVVFSSIVVHGVTVPLFKIGSAAVRTLSAGSSRGMSSIHRLKSRSMPSGSMTISGPMNARPLYASVEDNVSNRSEQAMAEELLKGKTILGSLGNTPRETTIEIHFREDPVDVRNIFPETAEPGPSEKKLDGTDQAA